MSAVTEQFEVDPAIIYPVIQSQAGTLAKAVLECVTNSYDASATRIDITIDQGRARVADNGHGMQTVEEVQKFFRKFGTPHQEGDSKVGRFRIGRGQAFVFGVTTWRTGPFRMVVDLRNKGLDYDRQTYEQSHDGCEIDIELYEPMSMIDYTSITQELSDMVYYMPIPVFLNGQQVNVLPQEQKWDVETDRYWLAVNNNSSFVQFFNQGHAVCREHLGIGGKVVTKPGVALDVNMSRSQIQHHDPVYKEVKEYFRALVREQSINKISRMDDPLRSKLFGQILTREIVFPTYMMDPRRGAFSVPSGFEDVEQWQDFANTLHGRSLMVSASGKGFSLSRFESASTWTIAPEANTMLADKLEQQGVVVVHPKVLNWLNLGDVARALKNGEYGANEQDAVGTQLTSALYCCESMARRIARRFTPFATLAANYSETHETVPKNKLSRLEVAQLHVLNRSADELAITLSRMAYWGHIGEEFNRLAKREVLVGRSDSGLAWTDGDSNIWIQRDELKKLNRGFAGAYELILTLLHEYCHAEDTSTGHQHDHAFYQSYHDASISGQVGQIIHGALNLYAKTLGQRNLKIPRTAAYAVDLGESLEPFGDDGEAA